MKSLLGLVVALAISGGLYFVYFKRMPVSDSGTAPTQAINLTGVRMDLLQIANAERAFEASGGRCSSLEELRSSGTMNLTRTERDGYTYEIRCGEGNQFQVLANHAPAPADSPIRYPILAVDETLAVGEVR